MNTQQPSRPVITPAMREQAAKQPNTWLYVVDPIFTDPSAEVPPWGFIGGYRVDDRGELTDDFSPNPNYRPSPVALRLPAPTNDVERALQLTTTGYAQGQTLLAALLDAELILFAQPQGNGLFTMDHESGRRQLQVFTSDTYLPANWTTWQRMTGRGLSEQKLAGTDVQINPTSPVKARIPGEELVKAAGATPAKTPAALLAGASATATPTPAPQPAAVQPTNGVALGPATNGHAPQGKSTPAAAKTTPPPEAPQPSAPNKVDPAPEAAPTAAPASSDIGQRFLGSMLAGAIGDALGAAIEFYPVDQIRNRFGAQGVTDYDRSGDRPGDFTDDTQMTLFTLEGLIRGHLAVRTGVAKSPLPAVQLAYQRWLHTQGHAWARAAGPFGDQSPEPNGWLIGQTDLFAVRSPGSSCITALRDFASGKQPGTFEHAINDAKGCSGVVRAAPAALWSDDPAEVFELAAATAALTTSNPSGYLPAGVLAVLVHRLVRGESLTEALGQARAILATCAGHKESDRVLQAAEDLAQQGKPTPEKLKDTLGGGWTGHEALAIAVCSALSTDNSSAGLMLAVNHSGDSDSTGAICGNIVGALYGSAALPGVWLRDLQQRDTIEILTKDALVEFGPKPPNDPQWAQRYPATPDTSELTFVSSLPPAGAAESLDEPAGPEPVDDRNGKILGCLLGGAVGDALGYPIESESLQAIRNVHGEAGLTDFVDGHRPGGSISDDTQMTLFTLEGMIRASIRRRLFGETEPATQVQQAYQRWLHTQGFDWKDAGGPLADSPADGWLIRQKGLFVRRAPGTTCIQALHGYATGKQIGSFTHRLNESKGCGGVMRAAPAGLWSDDPAEVFRVGALTAALTHGHPSGFLPAGALAVLVQQLVNGRSLPEAVERALVELSAWDGHEETTTCLRRAIELVADGTPTAEQIQDKLGAGWVGEEALAIAVCAALTHPKSFSDAIVLAANHSGDSDSTAAICGNIMGAAHTSTAIPEKWHQKLELREVIEALTQDAMLEFGPNPPTSEGWWERYPANQIAEDTASESASVEAPAVADDEESVERTAAIPPVDDDHAASVSAEVTSQAEGDTNPAVEQAPTDSVEDAPPPETGTTTGPEGGDEPEQDGIAAPSEAEPETSTPDSSAVTPEKSSSADSTSETTEDATPEDLTEESESGQSESEPTDAATAEADTPEADTADAAVPDEDVPEVDTRDVATPDADGLDADEPETASESGQEPTDEHVSTSESATDGSPGSAAIVGGVAAAAVASAVVAAGSADKASESESVAQDSASSAAQSTTVTAQETPPTQSSDAATDADSGSAGASSPAPVSAERRDQDADDFDDRLSDEELRLLTVWRKFRDSDEDAPSDLSDGLHKLLVEAFGPERAAQLVEESDDNAEQDQLAVQTPVELDRADRLAGCLLGGAAGDALAAPWIFTDLEGIQRENPKGLAEFAEAFGRRGAATAITQQSLFVFYGLMRAQISTIRQGTDAHWPQMVHFGLEHWVCTQGVRFAPLLNGGPFDESTALREQRFPDTATLSAVTQQHGSPDIPTASNPPNAAWDVAATARGAVIGFERVQPAAAITLAAEVAVTTHGHPDGYLPAAALAGLVSAVVDGQSLGDAVHTVLAELEVLEGSETTVGALRAALDLAQPGPATPEALEQLGTGWDAPEALAIAVAAALSHPNDFVTAVSLAATHSGHNPATAAICGSLMGTAHGVDAVPAQWRAVEVRETVEQLLADNARIGAEIDTETSLPDWAERFLA